MKKNIDFAKTKLELSLQSSQMGAWQYDIVENKRSFDNQACYLLGINPATFGGTAEEFFDAVHPEDHEKIKSALEQTIELKVMYEPEYRVIWPDGSIHHIAARGKLLCDDNGNPQAINGIIWDITERRKTEIALWENQEQYQSLIDNTVLGIAVMDTDYRIIRVNAMFAKMFKKPACEFVGKFCFNEFEKRDAICTHCPGARAMVSGKTEEAETQGVRDDGSQFHVHNRAIPYFGQDGKVKGFIEMIEDVDARKKMEMALYESEKRFKQVADNTAEFLWDIDASGLYTYASPAVERLFGYKPEEVIGKKYFYDFFVPEERKENKDTAFKIFAAKQSFRDFINRNLHRDGHIVWVATNGVPMLDGQGNLIGYRGSDMDITPQKQAEETLRRSETKYHMLYDTTSDAIMMLADGKFFDCNKSALEIYGCASIEEFCSKHPADFSPLKQPSGEESLTLANKHIAIAMEKGSNHFEWVHKRADNGKEFLADVLINAMELDGKKVVHTVVRDITERKQAEEDMKKLNSELEQTVARLEEANQELKNFVYIASHDLREPLRKISAFGSMLQKSLEGKIVDDDAENLIFMIDGAMRMSKMIEGLLVYSRVSTKAHSAEKVNLNDIVKQLSELELSVSIEEKNAVIEVPQPLPEVEADPVQLRQLMQNLISNGMKYQAKGSTPHITISSQPAADEMVRVNIADNGIGIAPEFQQAIFVMFKRLHSKNEYEGTGIGLAVCKKIVTRHGGQIGVESEPGKGSTFWFTLPTVNTAKSVPLQEATSKI